MRRLCFTLAIIVLILTGCNKAVLTEHVETRVTHEPVVTQWFPSEIERPIDLSELGLFDNTAPIDSPAVRRAHGETVIEIPAEGENLPPLKIEIKYHHEMDGDGLSLNVDSARAEYPLVRVERDSIATIVKEDTWGRRIGWIGIGSAAAAILLVMGIFAVKKINIKDLFK